MSTTSLDEEEKRTEATDVPEVSQPDEPEQDLSLARRHTSNTTTPPPPPDGGLRAWSQVLACLLVSALTWGTTYSFGVSQLHYTSTLKLPSAQVSWIGSVQVFIVFAMCTISGRLTDAGYARETAGAGCALATFGTFMTSLATEYWQILLAQGVCLGMGMGLVFMPAITVAGSYFQKRRAFALAVGACGSSVGGLVFPSTIQYLTPKIGFPWAMRCVGFLMLFFSILANLLLRPRVTPRRSGDIVDWPAFRELPYCLFALGSFLNFYGVYFALFYVSQAMFCRQQGLKRILTLLE
jgi:MFS family permease